MYLFWLFSALKAKQAQWLGCAEVWLLFLPLVLYFLLLSAAPAMPGILYWPLPYQLTTGAFF